MTETVHVPLCETVQSAAWCRVDGARARMSPSKGLFIDCMLRTGCCGWRAAHAPPWCVLVRRRAADTPALTCFSLFLFSPFPVLLRCILFLTKMTPCLPRSRGADSCFRCRGIPFVSTQYHTIPHFPFRLLFLFPFVCPRLRATDLRRWRAVLPRCATTPALLRSLCASRRPPQGRAATAAALTLITH